MKISIDSPRKPEPKEFKVGQLIQSIGSGNVYLLTGVSLDPPGFKYVAFWPNKKMPMCGEGSMSPRAFKLFQGVLILENDDE